MENDSAKFSVLIGEEINDNEQTSFDIELVASANRADETIDQIKGMLNSDVEVSKSAIFVLPCQPGNVDKLAELVERLFTDKECCEPAKDLSKQVTKGVFKYNVVKGQDRVFLVLNPGDSMAGMVEQQVQMFSMMGAPLLEKTTEATFSLKSHNTFTDIEQSMQGGSGFTVPALKSLAAQLEIKLNDENVQNLFQLLDQMQIPLAHSPLRMLESFIRLGLDLKFKSIDALPDQIKNKIDKNSNEINKKGLALPDDVKDWERPYLRELIDTIENGFEIYGVVEHLATVHLKTNAPGFGTHIVRNIQGQKNQD